MKKYPAEGGNFFFVWEGGSGKKQWNISWIWQVPKWCWCKNFPGKKLHFLPLICEISLKNVMKNCKICLQYIIIILHIGLNTCICSKMPNNANILYQKVVSLRIHAFMQKIVQKSGWLWSHVRKKLRCWRKWGVGPQNLQEIF